MDLGRLALRQEGEFWNAYWAPQSTMAGAILLGAIRLSLVPPGSETHRGFRALMQSAFDAIVEEKTGQTPTWSEPQIAPEAERSGSA